MRMRVAVLPRWRGLRCASFAFISLILLQGVTSFTALQPRYNAMWFVSPRTSLSIRRPPLKTDNARIHWLLEGSKTGNDAVIYNDDAFGLVFLFSSFAAKDLEFAGTFLVLSAVAAAGTNTGVWNKNADPRIPAAVAAAALCLRPFVAILVTHSVGGLEFPPLPDLGLTLASAVWGFNNWKNEQ